MSKQTLKTNAIEKMVSLLEPLSSEERGRLVRSAFAFLGETEPGAAQESSHQSEEQPRTNVGARAKSWLKQNSLSDQQIEQVFHLEEGNCSVIATELAGKSKKEKTLSAYVLAGTASLLSTDNPNFDDKPARELCESSGCYDSTNHAKYLQQKGNWLTGSKDKGWTITGPGLSRAAAMVKELTSQST